jgi:hypothetical protein
MKLRKTILNKFRKSLCFLVFDFSVIKGFMIVIKQCIVENYKQVDLLKVIVQNNKLNAENIAWGMLQFL